MTSTTQQPPTGREKRPAPWIAPKAGDAALEQRLWTWPARIGNAPADAVLERPIDGPAAHEPARPAAEAPVAGERAAGRAAERHGAVGSHWVHVAYAIVDIACVGLNGAIAIRLPMFESELRRHFNVAGSAPAAGPYSRYLGFLLLYAALILLFCQWQNLYRTPRTRSAAREAVVVVKAVLFATLLLSSFLYLAGMRIVPRFLVAVSFALNAAALVAWRWAKRGLILRRVERGLGARNALIVGTGAAAQALAREFERNKQLGYQFKGLLSANGAGREAGVVGGIEDLARLAKTEFADEVFITLPAERDLVKRIVAEGRRNRLDVKVVPDLYDGLVQLDSLRNVGDLPVMDLDRQPIPQLGFFVKRVVDVAVSAVALPLCLPLLGGLALWIKLDSRGPVLYASERIGKKGRTFVCYKLRTMVVNAEELKRSLEHRNQRQGPVFKIKDDPRVTAPGRFLRKYSFDELPQLWNVLKGDMSLIGPRPPTPDEYREYDPDYLRRLEVMPGITGLWQVAARQDPSFETNLKLDLQYIERWNLWLDFKIALRTARAVARGTGT